MKNKIIFKIAIFVIAIICLSFSKSYAAVEIKDSTSVLKSKTISDFYVIAEEMKNAGQGLEGTNVNVKMANNYEWAAISYFSNSSYGTGGVGQNSGIDFTTSVKTHKSTNGNVTGVMDWGRTYSYTAGIISDYASKTLTTTGNLSTDPTISAIVNNAGTDAVDKFSSSTSAVAIARNGWYSSWNCQGSDEMYPYSARQGLFGFCGGYSCWADWDARAISVGNARSDVTFRPVFYAQ